MSYTKETNRQSKVDMPWIMLTAQQVATMLGVSKATIKRVPYSKLPYSIVNTRGDRRYLMREVIEYVSLTTRQALNKVQTK